MKRRSFLKFSLLTGAGCLSKLATLAPCRLRKPMDAKSAADPKFKMDLSGSRIGITASQDDLIGLAQKFGFQAVDPQAWQLRALPEEKLKQLKAKLAELKLIWGSADLPVDFRQAESKFKDDLNKLPTCAKALQTAGVTKMDTWIMPCHNSLTYRENFRQHAKRLKETAAILEQHGIRLGLEYVGTKSLWASMKFPFIHTMKEIKELIAVVGENNVGLVLDSWHWTMAGETVQDIQTLKKENIVVCDLNDAPAGIPLEKQADKVRELPMATGVLDTKGFLGALKSIDYDGPIRAEPFNKKLDELENEPAAKLTAESLQKAFAVAKG